MDDVVQAVIERVTDAAARYDATQQDRLNRWRVLEPVAGRFVWFLAQAVGARNIVEIGTSRGVSTPVRVLRAGGVLVADNALSHPDEIAPLEDLLRRDLTAVTTIPVGKGELVARRP